MNILSLILLAVLIFLILIYINIYVSITQEELEKKRKENLLKTKPCLKLECDANLYFHRSRDQSN